MTVTELIELLVRHPHFDREMDSKVVIPVTKHYVAVGGKHCEEVTNFSFGFDWDSGKLFLHTEKKLTLLDETTEEGFKKFRDDLDKLAWKNQTLSAENRKLKKQLGNNP